MPGAAVGVQMQQPSTVICVQVAQTIQQRQRRMQELGIKVCAMSIEPSCSTF